MPPSHDASLDRNNLTPTAGQWLRAALLLLSWLPIPWSNIPLVQMWEPCPQWVWVIDLCVVSLDRRSLIRYEGVYLWKWSHVSLIRWWCVDVTRGQQVAQLSQWLFFSFFVFSPSVRSKQWTNQTITYWWKTFSQFIKSPLKSDVFMVLVLFPMVQLLHETPQYLFCHLLWSRRDKMSPSAARPSASRRQLWSWRSWPMGQNCTPQAAPSYWSM